MPFTQNDIIEQLSYAYLHAVAAASGFACEVVVSRLVDGAGVDARLSWKERLDEASVHTNSDVRIQLKATTKTPPKENGRFSYYLKDVESTTNSACEAVRFRHCSWFYSCLKMRRNG